MGELKSYLEGGGLQGKEIVKSTLFCKVHYFLYSDIKYLLYCFELYELTEMGSGEEGRYFCLCWLGDSGSVYDVC
jgi:hypothetical protein